MRWAMVTKCELHRVEVLYGASAGGCLLMRMWFSNGIVAGVDETGRPFR